MTDAVRRIFVRFVSRTTSQWHVRVYRATRGFLGGRRLRTRMLLLTTTGHRTGARHTVPLAYAQDGERLLLVAGNVVLGRTPHWLRNVRASPRVEVQIGGRSREMNARELTGDDRDRAWPAVERGVSGIGGLQARHEAPIPVVALTS